MGAMRGVTWSKKQNKERERETDMSQDTREQSEIERKRGDEKQTYPKSEGAVDWRGEHGRLFDDALPDDETVSCSLFLVCLHRCKDVYTVTILARESGKADRPGPAPEMRTAQVTEKPARVVGGTNARIIVNAQHSPNFPPHAKHDPGCVKESATFHCSH
jgi:hypothetical protein